MIVWLTLLHGIWTHSCIIIMFIGSAFVQFHDISAVQSCFEVANSEEVSFLRVSTTGRF